MSMPGSQLAGKHISMSKHPETIAERKIRRRACTGVALRTKLPTDKRADDANIQRASVIKIC